MQNYWQMQKNVLRSLSIYSKLWVKNLNPYDSLGLSKEKNFVTITNSIWLTVIGYSYYIFLTVTKQEKLVTVTNEFYHYYEICSK